MKVRSPFNSISIKPLFSPFYHVFLSLRSLPHPLLLRQSKIVRAVIGQSQGLPLSHWFPGTSIKVTSVSRVGDP